MKRFSLMASFLCVEVLTRSSASALAAAGAGADGAAGIDGPCAIICRISAGSSSKRTVDPPTWATIEPGADKGACGVVPRLTGVAGTVAGGGTGAGGVSVVTGAGT